MARKPTPPISYGDDVALPGVGTPGASGPPAHTARGLTGRGDGAGEGGGARSSTSPRRRWSTSIRPGSTSFGNTPSLRASK